MRNIKQGGPVVRSEGELSALACSVVVRLAARGGLTARPADLDLVLRIRTAIASADPARFDALRPELRRARISDADLVDSYFPEVARLLGCDWADDRAGWADVSMGMARLQALVHQISRDWSNGAVPDGADVLVVLPEGEQHGFGVQVLAEQLRRQGVAVHQQIGARPSQLRSLVQERSYDCALISIGCEEKLELGRKLVKSLKDGTNGRLWVAVGGAVLERVDNVARLTGADIATNDPFEAIAGAGRASFLGRSRLQHLAQTTERRLEAS